MDLSTFLVARHIYFIPLGDLAAFHIETRNWFLFPPSLPSPWPRYEHTMVANSDRILNNGGLLSDARGHPKDDNSLWVLETKRLVHHIEASTIAPPPLQPDQFSEQHRPVEDTNMPRLYDRMASTEAEDPIIPEVSTRRQEIAFLPHC
jgi:hypothetical protein